MSGVVAALNSLDEFRTLTNSGQVVIVDYWAPWCGPCRFVSPIFEKLAAEPQFSSIKFVKVNVDEQEDISQEVGIRAMPTFQVFKDGQKIDELVGADPSKLEQLVLSHA
ncbi:thioredoxin [Aspergillus tamarii]|uniref:Thioredoxin n=1 Tax=Aspergillus tamarii TaxID=41984 RepID=A0A5N6VDA2_ASPTM|nr:thioredoxin [Aspergillus tamarii]